MVKKSLNDRIFEKIDGFFSDFEWYKELKLQVECHVANYVNELQEKKQKQANKENK